MAYTSAECVSKKAAMVAAVLRFLRDRALKHTSEIAFLLPRRRLAVGAGGGARGVSGMLQKESLKAGTLQAQHW
jgi:hypothetical protein